MGDEEFDDLLDDYLSGRSLPNSEMEDVEIEWVRGNPEFGADHIGAHDVTVEEVEEVLLKSRLRLRRSVIKTTRTERFSGEQPLRAVGCSFRARTARKEGNEF